MALGSLELISEQYRTIAGLPPVEEGNLLEAPATPTDAWLKVDIQEWLERESIPYPAGASKAELLAIVHQPSPLEE